MCCPSIRRSGKVTQTRVEAGRWSVNERQPCPPGMSWQGLGQGGRGPVADLASARGSEVHSCPGIHSAKVLLTLAALGLLQPCLGPPVYIYQSCCLSLWGDTAGPKTGPAPPGVCRLVEGTDSKQVNQWAGEPVGRDELL